MNNSTLKITKIPTELTDFINNINYDQYQVSSNGNYPDGDGGRDVYTNDWNINIKLPTTGSLILNFNKTLTY